MDGERTEAAVREEFVRRVAEVASAVGFQAGVAEMEIAGLIVSCLYANPEHIDRFMEEGWGLFINGTLSPRMGSLSYVAMNGQITSPSTLRQNTGTQQ